MAHLVEHLHLVVQTRHLCDAFISVSAIADASSSSIGNSAKGCELCHYLSHTVMHCRHLLLVTLCCLLKLPDLLQHQNSEEVGHVQAVGL